MAQQKEKPIDPEKRARESLPALVGDQVLHALGKPGDLQRIQVRRLWGDRFRVNVLVGTDVSSARVAHSFFVLADGDGNIIKATPEVTKKY